MSAPKRQFFPVNRQGITIDVLAMIASVAVVPFVVSRIGYLFDESFRDHAPAITTLALLMLATLSFRLAGLYLKRFPLQARLVNSDDGAFPLMFVVFSIPLLILTSAFAMTLLQTVAVAFGVIEKAPGGGSGNAPAIAYMGVSAILVLVVLEGFLLYRLSRPLSARQKTERESGDWKYSRSSEYLSDFCLFTYMLVWQVFYYQVAEMFMTMPDGRTMPTDMRIVSLIFVLIAFMLFYVAPRAVFLIEDRKHPGTWLFILLVFVTSTAGHWLV